MNPIINKIKQEAPFLDSLKNRLLLIFFLIISILIFLTVYTPFNMNNWGGSILVYVGIGIFVMLISQFALRHFLGFQKFKWYQLILWALGELGLISYLIYLIYSPGFDTTGEELAEFILTLKFTFLVFVGPYVFIIRILDTRHEMASFKSIELKTKPDDRIINELLTIVGDNSKVLLAVKYEHLVLIKSSGNYVNIHYLKGDRVVKELIRLSLKELESNLKNPHILRIHRSYIVNKRMITSFKKERKRYKLHLQHLSEEVLPVSQGYMKSFEVAMSI